MKVSTWTYKEPGHEQSARARSRLEIERLAGQSLEYTTGMALGEPAGARRGAAANQADTEREIRRPGDGVYSSMIAVDPGEYRLILSMADSEGRIGSVTRAVTAWQMNAASVIAMGDLAAVGTARPEPRSNR